MRGFVVSKALHAAAALGVADHLHDGPRSAVDLAAACGCDADALERLLRALSSSGVFVEGPAGQFGVTAVGTLLRSDRPSLRNWVLMNGELVYPVVGDMLETVRTGEAASSRVLGRNFFEHLSVHPDLAAVFDEAMRDMTAGSAELVLQVCDLGGTRSIVDVGGGDGTLLLELLHAVPAAHGTVLDLPAVVARARDRAEAKALSGRLRFEPGSFFEDVPSGADVYLLAWVLHDWDDEAAGRILASCRRAMTATSRLLILEAVLPPTDVVHFSHYGDLVMMALFEGRERTCEHLARLLQGNGLRVHAVHTTSSPRSVLDVRLRS